MGPGAITCPDWEITSFLDKDENRPGVEESFVGMTMRGTKTDIMER